MMNRNEIAAQLIEIVREEMNYKAELNEKLSNFLNSVTFIKVLVKIEKSFAIKFADNEFNHQQFNTLNQVVELVMTKLGK